MKHLLVSFSLFIFVFTSQASHLKGGYITYKWLSGRTYEVTLVTFSDPNSPADLNTLSVSLSLGDSDSYIVQRSARQIISPSVVENIYTTTHTYQEEGVYMISYTDQSLIDGIVNINGGNSTNSTLFLESMLNINGFNGISNSPQPYSLLPDPIATSGNAMYYNSTWFTKKGTNQMQFGEDSISYEMLVGLDKNTNYTLPPGLSIDAYSGMINWKNVPTVYSTMPLLYFIEIF